MTDYLHRHADWRRLGRPFLLTATLIGLVLSGIGRADAATTSVAAVNFEFQPATRSVHVGDVVRWIFAGDPHTVTSGEPGSPDGQFDSGIRDPGATYQVTFDTEGTFRYFCQIHPEQMTGTIVVAAGGGATPAPTAKPTAKPTARPTAKPTARPTQRPAVTAAPTVHPTATPSPSTVPASATPSATAPAQPTVSPSSTAVAGASGEPGPSGAVTSPPPGNEPDAGAAGALDPTPIVIGAVLLGLILAGGLVLARRWRGAA